MLKEAAHEARGTLSYWGYIRVILGVYWDNGKENGSYYIGLRVSDGCFSVGR